MNEEKKMILDMLKEGKITVDQASDLLDAIGKDKARNNEESFVDKLSTSFEKIMKKTSEKLSNIDLDLDLQDLNIPSNFHKLNASLKEDQTNIDDDINKIKVDLINGGFKIERSQENSIIVDQKVYFKDKEDTEKDYLKIDVVEDELVISVNEAYKDLDARPEVKLYLGKNIYDNLDIDILNGDIEICDVDFKENKIYTTNAKTRIINSAGDIEINNTNGKIDLNNTNGKTRVKNVNGSVYLTNMSADDAEIEAVNGSIRIDGLNVDKLKLKTNLGSVRLYKIKEAKNVEIDTLYGSVTVDTEGFDKDIKALLDASSYNISEKFKNKLEKSSGYEVSTNPEKTDLDLKVKTVFGKAVIA